ncbi:MAG: helix-turn-helix transcriptional regulator [Lachnospiraceae bacterium]|nr:helix-turn-helix transcriptional regulator [Lachnospiraceae bacterium]MDY4095660.1 helix-turn-helix transcriptional regulator [Lachnospiraceae bacterium]
MFNENLKRLRKEKGFSQEELAAKLNIVRQTISKWEKGLSVPDAQLLIRLSEILEIPVATLLGGTNESEESVSDKNAIAEQLSRINSQLSERTLRNRRTWSIVKTVLISIIIITFLIMLLSVAK